MVFKKNDEPICEDERPKVPDFKMDPEYRKFILSDEYDENGVRIKPIVNSKKKTESEKKNNKNIQKSEIIAEAYGKDTGMKTYLFRVKLTMKQCIHAHQVSYDFKR